MSEREKNTKTQAEANAWKAAQDRLQTFAKKAQASMTRKNGKAK
jgi:hypothetical protein